MAEEDLESIEFTLSFLVLPLLFHVEVLALWVRGYVLQIRVNEKGKQNFLSLLSAAASGRI